MLSIQHNMQALVASNLLNRTTTQMRKKTENLSSGYRINRGADDAAGLAISEKMRRQIRGLTQASANAQDGISMVQIADGAMAEIQDMLHRMNELSIKSANETLTADDREYIQAEIKQLTEEIGAVSHKTTFNEMPLLLGPAVTVEAGVEYRGNLPGWISHTGGGYMSSSYTTDEPYTSVLNGPGVFPVNHEAAYVDFSSFTGTAGEKTDLLGNGFHTTCCTCDAHYSVEFTEGSGFTKSSSGNHYIYQIGIDGATSGEDLVDRILAAATSNPNNHFTMLEKNPANANELIIYDGRSNETTDFTLGPADAVFSDPLAPMLATANSRRGKFGPGVAQDISATTPGNKKRLLIGSEATDANILTVILPNMRIENLNISHIDVRTPAGARGAVESLKYAGRVVSSERSRMGAYQNRLEHTINNLDIQVENTQAAESVIRDADMAKEMVEYSRNQILLQAGQAMLAQANQTNEGVLALLS